MVTVLLCAREAGLVLSIEYGENAFPYVLGGNVEDDSRGSILKSTPHTHVNDSNISRTRRNINDRCLWISESWDCLRAWYKLTIWFYMIFLNKHKQMKENDWVGVNYHARSNDSFISFSLFPSLTPDNITDACCWVIRISKVSPGWRLPWPAVLDRLLTDRCSPRYKVWSIFFFHWQQLLLLLPAAGID